jgi:16S rRNA (uracil1498-N3)-methyltransferase
MEATASIAALGKDRVHVEIAAPVCALRDSALRITLYQGLPKGDKLDEILQKCTELGIDRVVPFVAERSVNRPGGERRDRKVRRWEKIVLEAARQSGRSSLPSVGFADCLFAAIQGENSSLGLLLWEEEQEQRLKTVLERTGNTASIAVIVGPEGGLTDMEAAAARSAGFMPVTLGRRILRTETAGPAIVAILQYILGDIG